MPWLCDDSPPMVTTMDFKSTGTVTMVFSIQGQEPVLKEATWTLSEDTIDIFDEFGYITGTVSGNTMTGFYEENDENFNFYGTWTVTRQ